MTSRWKVNLPGSSLTLMFLLTHLSYTHKHSLICMHRHSGGSSELWSQTLPTEPCSLPWDIYHTHLSFPSLFLLLKSCSWCLTIWNMILFHRVACLFMPFSIYAILWPPCFNSHRKQCVLTLNRSGNTALYRYWWYFPFHWPYFNNTKTTFTYKHVVLSFTCSFF